MTSAPPAASWWRTVFVFGPHAGAHRVALRAGISVVIPLLTVWALGHVEWSLYAAFGSFTALYGRNLPARFRYRMQVSAAVVLVAAVVLGVLLAALPGREWWIVIAGSLWATLVALASEVFRWNPPGPLFGVFALCAVASVPPTPGALPIAATVAGGSALLSLVVGAVGRRLPADEPGPRETLRSVPSERVLHAVRFGVAAALAGGLSTALGIGHPYWAMIAAVVPLVAVHLSHALVRATHRVGGTLLGLVVAALLLALHPSGLWAIALVVALQMAAELFIARNYGFALLFVTPLALVMIDLAHPGDDAALIADRFVETALGTVVALAVAAATHAFRGRRSPA